MFLPNLQALESALSLEHRLRQQTQGRLVFNHESRFTTSEHLTSHCGSFTRITPDNLAQPIAVGLLELWGYLLEVTNQVGDHLTGQA